MTDREHALSLTRQAELLGISRGSLYYEPRPVSDEDLRLMRRIDELHMDYPFAGSRMMKGLLRQEGFTAGRLHVATLMKTMGIEALYRRPNTSKPTPGHKIFPYLLRKLAVTRPNQVWAMDITYIPMARGFVYLTAVIDWFSRKVLAWRLSVTLESGPCIEALKEAMRRHGPPEIMNTDQGSQFTSIDFIKVLKDADIQISMDGKGAWRDNVFVERLWRTIKYEEVYLRAYDSVSAAREIIAWHKASEASQRLATAPGVGPLTATALIAAVGDASQFPSARHFAAWLGLTPRMSASGSRAHIGRISKGGDRYLRTLLIHGARAMAGTSFRRGVKPRPWLQALIARRPVNVASVAVAHKTARALWAMIRREEAYRPPTVFEAAA